jgi:hypothetical protein
MANFFFFPGIGKFHWKLLLVCAAGWMVDGMSLTVVSNSMSGIQTEWQISTDYIGLMSRYFPCVRMILFVSVSFSTAACWPPERALAPSCGAGWRTSSAAVRCSCTHV